MAWLKYREGADITSKAEVVVTPKAEVVDEAVGGANSTISSPHTAIPRQCRLLLHHCTTLTSPK